MATIAIKIPGVGESVTEALLAQWYKKDGERVRRDEPLLLLETDKVTLEVAAEAAGVLHIAVPAGTTVAIGAVVGTIETEEETAAAPPPTPAPEAAAAKPAARAAAAEAPPTPAPPASSPAAADEPAAALAPSVRRLVAEHRLDLSRVVGTGPGGRITKGDVLRLLEEPPAAAAAAPPEAPPSAAPAAVCPPAGPPPPAESVRQPMSPIRRRIAERLLKARQNTAMLTTFNDIDMSAVIALRRRYKEPFQKKHGVALGFMSFFIKAAVEALKAVPQINAAIDGSDIVSYRVYHIGVAVGSERGLVVPVIRHADRLSFAELERAIAEFVRRIQENRIALADLEGGTFTITNGGVFGSLLSTPILNPPQSGILGMHRVEERPVAANGQVVIRPMMYVALSYDHRIVDGREAVTFLRHVKECIENPERILMEI